MGANVKWIWREFSHTPARFPTLINLFYAFQPWGKIAADIKHIVNEFLY